MLAESFIGKAIGIDDDSSAAKIRIFVAAVVARPCQFLQFRSPYERRTVSNMADNAQVPGEDSAQNPVSGNRRPFMLTEGGPTYKLEVRLGLIRESSPRILRRAFLSVLVTWLPLLILSALQGTAIGHLVPVPFLRDFATYTRFLLAVPVLLLAETILGPRLAGVANHFVESRLVLEKDFDHLESAIDRGLHWRDSAVVELILLVLAYVIAAINLLSMSLHVSTWYALRTDHGISFTWPGWWFVFFCVPLLQFLTLRWLWRLFLWAQFLWRMNRLDLQLIPTHPDQAGGLAFVGESQRFFGIILFGLSAAVAGVLANGIIYDKMPLPHFGPVIAAYVFIAVAIVLMPLLVFCKTLLRTKRFGLYKYGSLATEYTSSFQQKWIVKPRQSDEPLLGTGDIQSLADLGNSYFFIEKMNAIPMRPRTPIHLVLACVIPMTPLLLTMMPLAEVLKMVLKVVL